MRGNNQKEYASRTPNAMQICTLGSKMSIGGRSVQRIDIRHRGTNSIQFANAVNRTAHLLQRHIGISSETKTFMYMGFPDLRTYIVLVAA